MRAAICWVVAIGCSTQAPDERSAAPLAPADGGDVAFEAMGPSTQDANIALAPADGGDVAFEAMGPSTQDANIAPDACAPSTPPHVVDGGLSIDLDLACCTARPGACGMAGDASDAIIFDVLLRPMRETCGDGLGYIPAECHDLNITFDETGCATRVSHDVPGHAPDDPFMICIARYLNERRWPCLEGRKLTFRLASCTM